MNFDPQIAEAIVINLKDVINHEINLFDTTGTIIASTDSTRIGTSHEGARLAIETKQTVAIDSEHQFRGAKHGINVPVMFQDAAVAVIGITGKRSEVEPFGNVIKKMTEILIRENWDRVEQYDRRARISNLVNLLTLRDHDTSLAAYCASVLQINLDIPRIVVISSTRAPETDVPDLNGLYGMIHARFQSLPTSFFSFMGRDVYLFIDAKHERLLPDLLENLSRDSEHTLHCPLIFGVGRTASASALLWRSFEEARCAVEWLSFSGTETTLRYENMDLGLLVGDAQDNTAAQFVQHVFAGLTEKEIDEFEQIFEAYTRHNGSIVHCADELYLHKNTLQNRLNKIAAKTGYNPRTLADHTVLAMAFLMRNYRRHTADAQ